MEIDEICVVIENYIYKKKGKKVVIDRYKVQSNFHQLNLLLHCYNYAIRMDKQ